MIGNKFFSFSSCYCIFILKLDEVVLIKVIIMLEVVEELYEMVVEVDGEGDEELKIEMFMFKDDLVLFNFFLSLGVIFWEIVIYLWDNIK